jgi:hypothetical protein
MKEGKERRRRGKLSDDGYLCLPSQVGCSFFERLCMRIGSSRKSSHKPQCATPKKLSYFPL